MAEVAAKRASKTLRKDGIDVAVPGDWLWDRGTRGISGLCLRVTPGGTKTFMYRYRTEAGTQRYVKLGNYPSLTIDQARDLASKRAWQVAEGKDPSKARKSLRETPTVAALAHHYLTTYAASQSLRDSTVKAARAVLASVLPSIGKLKVSEVSPDDIRRVRAKVKADGIAAAKADAQRRARELVEAETALANAERAMAEAEKHGRPTERLRWMADARARERIRAAELASRAEAKRDDGRAGIHQANRLLAVLSVMFNLAKASEGEWGAIQRNPCEGIRKDREDERWRNLSEEEVAALLDACDTYEREQGMTPHARGGADAVRLLLFTGARLREVLRAEWRQFELDRGMWEKPSAHTKSKRQHRLELDGPALDLLRQMHTRRTNARFLFPGDPSRRHRADTDAARQPQPRADLKRPWARMVELAGLEDVRLHDLRRTTASFMLSGGASLATVGKSLGHTQARTTQRYAQLSATVQREGLKAAGERMVALRGQAGTDVDAAIAGRRP